MMRGRARARSRSAGGQLMTPPGGIHAFRSVLVVTEKLKRRPRPARGSAAPNRLSGIASEHGEVTA